MSMLLTSPLMKRRVSYFVDVGAVIAFVDIVVQARMSLGSISCVPRFIYGLRGPKRLNHILNSGAKASVEHKKS